MNNGVKPKSIILKAWVVLMRFVSMVWFILDACGYYSQIDLRCCLVYCVVTRKAHIASICFKLVLVVPVTKQYLPAHVLVNFLCLNFN